MQRIKHLVRLWLLSLLRLFFPRQCPVCGCLLQEGEAGICLRCNMDMPRTGYHQLRDNPMERMLWGKMPLERATAYFFYRKGSGFRHIVHQMKYDGRQDLAETMGRLMAQELLPSGFFDSIDLLLPVPLHPAKERKRGYNQSERLAQGIAAVTVIPIDNSSVTRLADRDTNPQVCLRTVGERGRNLPAAPSGTVQGRAAHPPDRRRVYHRCHHYGMCRRFSGNRRITHQRADALHRRVAGYLPGFSLSPSRPRAGGLPAAPRSRTSVRRACAG